MSATAFVVVRALHIASMIIWIGGPLVAAIGARRAILAGGQTAIDRVAWFQSISPVFIAAGLTTFATGGVLLWSIGYAAIRTQILVGAGLATAAFPVGGAMMRPALTALQEHFAAGRSGNDAAGLVGRFQLAHAIDNGLKVAALFLMTIRL